MNIQADYGLSIDRGRQAAPLRRTAPHDRAHAVAMVLKAIANPWRYRVLCLLAGGELSVDALERDIGITQSALSQHLSRLRETGLVRTRRQRQQIFYSLAAPAVADLVATLCLSCEELIDIGPSVPAALFEEDEAPIPGIAGLAEQPGPGRRIVE